jgi:pimeloyl-ACP methyl ester carboxylesterase
MPEETIEVGGVDLCYETFGEAGNPAALLIMGLNTQMVAWHDDFCADLAARGSYVIRFDNRDVGRSGRIDAGPPPSILRLVRRDKRAASYTLDDLAGDAVGLLDALDVERAHIIGASMGGMIAQTLAARYPERVLSLASIMSNTGSRWTGQPALRAYRVLMRRPPRDREGYVRHQAWVLSIIGSPGFPPDDDVIRTLAGRSYDRGLNPAAAGRQLAAIIASGDRTPLLRTISAPTVVVHGTADRLVAPSGGRSTAKAIPGARLVTIEGMGHDLPRPAWPRILDAIEENAARAVPAEETATPH